MGRGTKLARWVLCAASAAAALTAITTGTAKAADEEVPQRTQVDYRFEHPVSLTDAARIVRRGGYDVLAYRFENEQVVGEYSPASGVSIASYLARMKDQLGTNPEVVGFSAPFDAGTEADAARGRTTISVAESPEFRAPPVSPAYFHGKAAAAGKLSTQAPSSNLSLAATGDWRPDLIQTRVVKWPSGGRVDFDMSVYWDSPTTPGYIPADYGLEVGVELYNGASSTLLRPACAAGYKDKFFAKNYGWNWYAVDEQFGWLTAAHPYADYNDLTDPCNRNSMTIGLRTPQAIPLSYQAAPYDWAVYLHLDAQQGTQSTNLISGDAGLVTEGWCTSHPTFSNTDCMGVAANGSTVANGLHRSFLSASRGWTAPDKCWSSASKGSVAPTLLIPGSTSGCF